MSPDQNYYAQTTVLDLHVGLRVLPADEDASSSKLLCLLIKITKPPSKTYYAQPTVLNLDAGLGILPADEDASEGAEAEGVVPFD